MDQVSTYKQIVRRVIGQIADMSPSDDEVDTQVIIDEEGGHYLLFSIGWERGSLREYSPFVHIDVKPDGKVWVQHDGTNLKIALMLAEAGIPKKHIVLGFRAPFRREEMAEFAPG